MLYSRPKLKREKLAHIATLYTKWYYFVPLYTKGVYFVYKISYTREIIELATRGRIEFVFTFGIKITYTFKNLNF